jgi:uncharacterized protein YjdB
MIGLATMMSLLCPVPCYSISHNFGGIVSKNANLSGKARTIPALSCNTQTAFKAPEFDNLSAQINDGVASIIPLCVGNVNNVANLIDNSTANFATISITGLNCDAQIGVKDNDGADTYPAGTWAGYKISTAGLLGAAIAASVTISTYNNNVLAESKIVTNAGLSINTFDVLSDGTAVVGMTTTQPFDEIRIRYQSLVAILFTVNIYHPVIAQFCSGPEPSCNRAASWVNPAYPVYIDNSGVSGLGLAGISNEWALLDSSQSNSATIAFPVAALASAYISVKDRLTNYPSGYFAGFEISFPAAVSVNIGQYVSITTYLNDVQQEVSSGPELLLAIPLNNSSSKIITGFVASAPFNEIRITISQPLSINLNTFHIYRSVIKKYCEGPQLSCNTTTNLTQPDFPVELSSDETGFSGLACLACEIINPTAIVNDDSSDYTQIELLTGVGTTASLAFEKLGTLWQDSIFIGFDIETNHLLDVNILDAIQLCTYEDNVLKECKTGSSGLLQIDSKIFSSSSRRTIGFVSNYSFDQIKLSLFNTASITLGATKVYALSFDSLCKFNVVCDSSYFLNHPDFPVVINGFQSGIKGGVCALCSVEDEQNVISASATDFAKIELTAGVLAYGTISVVDGLSTYPAGVSAGFTIRDMGGLAKLDLFESITVCTWLNGSLQECKTDADLIDLTLLVNIFGPASGMYNVGFHTSLPFDEISIRVASLASVINSVRIYGAFVDTRGGNINGLSCCVYPSTIELGTYCVGQTDTLAGHPAGYWTSSNPAIISINAGHIAQSVSAGSAQLSYYNATSLCLESRSNFIEVNALPVISTISPQTLCMGDTAHIMPASGGFWTSGNNAIASITNNGKITAISPGTCTFSYTSAATLCVSNPSAPLIVNARPVITPPAGQYLCMGASTNYLPATGGTWSSSNALVASIDNTGQVVANAPGSAFFTFVSNSTLCASNPTSPLWVVARPNILLPPTTQICQGTFLQLQSDSVGVWRSLNPSIAGIDSVSGVVSAHSSGTAWFYLHSTHTFCNSDSATSLQVLSAPTISYTGTTSICQGHFTRITSATSGVWSSSNHQIADIDITGTITALAPGKVGFTFRDAATQCESSTADDLLTILHCLDPDFNVGFTLLALTGNLATNDEFPGTSYSNATIVLKKPAGATASLTVQSSGAYTFVGDLPGRYEFSIPVCRVYAALQCQNQNLSIYLVNRYGRDYFPIVNTDMITIINKDHPAGHCLINLCCNDKCITNDDCYLSRQSQSVTKSTDKGSADFNLSDTLYFAPAQSMRGLDTLYYRFCSDVDPGLCDTAVCNITIADSTAVNAVVAVDDFFSTRSDSMLVGSLLINDSDPEGNVFAAIPAGSVATPVVLPQGKYYITNSGFLYFTPTASFAGPLDIVYTICDDGLPSACSKATAHILVFRDLKIRIKAFLEGALMNSSSLSSSGKPLMRDDLRNEPNTGKNLIPLADPFQFATPYSDMTQNFNHKWPGNMQRYKRISDSTSVFGVTGENAIVDWVFVELRNKSNPTQILATRAALLQRDGDVVDLSGNGSLIFRGTQIDSCYIALHHRTHLGVMSKKTNATALVDFTSYLTQPFDFGTTHNNGFDYTGLALNANIKPGYRALWSGDFVKNGKIKFTNPLDDLNALFYDILSHPDNVTGNSNYNFAYGYYQGDYNLDGKIKFDNPSDDKNMLYAQIIFYPLNFEYLTNFDFFLEQIPK